MKVKPVWIVVSILALTAVLFGGWVKPASEIRPPTGQPAR